MSDQRSGDEAEIRRLVAVYADAVGSRDEATWAATWTEDGVWDLGGLARAEGRDTVVETWKRLMGAFRFVTQQPQYGVLEIAGDTATGVWHINEYGWPRSGPGSLTLGLYRDAYRREAGRWRFAERRFAVLYSGAPDLSGEPGGYPEV